jgi:hypothetical protein
MRRPRAIGTGSPLALRRGGRGGGTSARFSTQRKQGGRRGHGAECKLRFARSALNPYSVVLDVLPASSVLKFFLYCETYVFPPCREQQRIQAIGLPEAGRHARSAHPPQGAARWLRQAELIAGIEGVSSRPVRNRAATPALGRPERRKKAFAPLPSQRASFRRQTKDRYDAIYALTTRRQL